MFAGSSVGVLAPIQAHHSAPPWPFRFEPMTRNFETFRLLLISNSTARCAARLFVCLFTDVTASPVATMKRLHASPVRAGFTLIADPFTWIVGFAEKSIIVSLLVLALLFLPSLLDARCR